MSFSTSEIKSEGQSWQVHKFHCPLSVDYSEKECNSCCFPLSILEYEVRIFLGLCCCSGAGTRSWCSLDGYNMFVIYFILSTLCRRFLDFSNSVAAFVVGKRKLPRLALLAFPHDSKQLLMDLFNVLDLHSSNCLLANVLFEKFWIPCCSANVANKWPWCSCRSCLSI